MTEESWTTLSLLRKATEHLTEKGFIEARLNAELLLAHTLGLRRMDLYLQFDRPLTGSEIAAFRGLFKRRLAHEPVQYIVGETEFMGCALKVGPGVLIPRPETELLVEKAIELLRSLESETPRVLDIGTGSGNIPVAIARFVPAAAIVALDISEEALAVAAENVRRNGAANVRLVRADLHGDFLPGEFFDLITSNPPYVSPQEFEGLPPEIRNFEPKIATTDGCDGLQAIRRVLEIAASRLEPQGVLLMEIGYGQAGEVRGLCESAGLALTGLYNDFSGIPRVVRATRSPGSGRTVAA